MSTIQFGGVISGLNTQGIIDALVGVKKQPLVRLQTQESDLTAQKAGYTQVGSAIDALVATIKNFTVTSAGASRTASSTDSSVVSASVGNSAAVATYQITVDHLATATRATSATSLGSAVTTAVDTSALLSKANLATPVTTGHMAINVDGTMVQVTVGDPTTTSLQSVMDSIASAIQTQLQTTDPASTVAASISGGQLQISISGNSSAHDISFGDVGDTSNLATAFGLTTAGVTASTNPTITGAYLDPTLSSLNLPGSVTAGQISAIVDGTIVHYTVGDPTKTTLDQMLKGFSAAISSQLQAGGTNVGADATATMTASVVGNKLQLAITGGGLAHSLSFGAAGDGSNALGMLGISYSSVASSMNPTLTGATNLGVVRMNGSLDGAGLTGLTSTKTGVLTINGIAINYDTTSDTLTSVVTRINNSSAGVIASVDRTNDQLILTRKDTGSIAIDIQDSGTLGAALKLAPGTTNSQVIGDTAQVTVDGRVITSTSNTVTSAIDGVSLNLVSQSVAGKTETLTVGVDQTAISAALSQFITSFNSLGDLMDSLTAVTPGTAGGTAGTSGPLSSDTTARSLYLNLRDLLFSTSGSGTMNSLGAIGLNTGALGSLAGSTNRVQLDSAALTAALNSDANQVTSLLDSSTGPMATVLASLQSYEDPSNPSSYVQAHVSGLTSDITETQHSELDAQEMVDNYQATLEAQYATMEATLATLQSQSSALASQLGQTTTSTSSGLSSSTTGSTTG
jgi:flagellar hook-associated protein 2